MSLARMVQVIAVEVEMCPSDPLQTKVSKMQLVKKQERTQ